MKIVMSVLNYLLLMLTLLLPAGGFLLGHFGYIFSLTNVAAFILSITMLSVVIVILDRVFHIPIQSKFSGIVLSCLPPLSIFAGAMLILRCQRTWAFLCLMIYIGCCYYLSVRHGKPKILKIISLILSVLMILPITIVTFAALLLSNFGKQTVMQTIPSPSGQYYAQVIDDDQGALGGNTLVDVYENIGIDSPIFQAKKEPQRVYVGDWGEFQTMQIYWKDDHCLVINGIEYQIE